jgi:Domain of unknown function (DUF4139)/N-terminal domain of unknown function (DUF4140)
MVVESRISEVTIYARGARIRRVMTIALEAGASRVRIAGLPAAVIDDTVRIEAEGDALVTGLHVGLEAPPPEAAADEDAPEVRAARARAARATAEVERLDAALAILAAAPIALPLPEADVAVPAWSAVVEARHALVTWRAERELALRDHLAAARRETDEAQRALAAVVDRDRRAGSARAARLHELRKHVELEIAGSGVATVHLEYQVAAARWAPSYVARIDGDAVAFELRAVIAQDTGEDWTGVALRLSTAEPERFGALPELSAQRIGRRQREPVRAGFRAPPIGAGELYLDYARAFAPAPPAPPPSPYAAAGPPDHASDGHGGASPGYSAMSPTPPPPGMAPPIGAPGSPQMVRASMPQPFGPPLGAASPSRARAGLVGGIAAGIASSLGGGGSRELEVPSPAIAPPPPPPPRLDYANLRMAPAGSAQRGTLIAAPRDRRIGALDGEVAAAAARVDALGLPRGCSAAWSHAYDYAFATDGRVDVVADAAWHSIAVTARPSTAKLRHVAVPREQADVFRLAEIANPLSGPLLPGPIDVYDRGRFLVTSAVEHTPPGASVAVGLGVDAAVKLARNTEFSEEATGVLRGGLRLHHVISIEVDNLSDRAIELEVRERLPVTREGDDDVEVITGKVEPAWERWTPDPDAPRDQRLRGGYRWRVTVPPHDKRALRAAYDVKLAGKLELVGGNRRES